MDNLENKPSLSPVTSTPASLEEQLESLRHMVTSVLVLVVIISAAFNIYLWRQVKYMRQDIAAYRPQAAAVVSEFEKTIQPQMRDFLAKVQEFGRTHPNDPAFGALMQKYGLKNLQLSNAPAATPPVSAAPQGATTGPAKK